jgi:hypothetical protein
LLKGMALLMAMAGPQTPLGQALGKAIQDVGKHVPPGSSSEQGQQNFAQAQVMQNQKMMAHRAAIAAQQQPPQQTPQQGAAPMAA